MHVFLANLLSEDWSEGNLGWSPFFRYNAVQVYNIAKNANNTNQHWSY